MTREYFPMGTVVRLKSDPGEDWDARVGTTYIVTDIVPAAKDLDPPAECYELEPAPGQGYWSSGEYAPVTADFEIVRTAVEQRELMDMPTNDEVITSVLDAISRMDDEFEFVEGHKLTTPATAEDFESTAGGFTHGVEIYAHRRDGASFGFTLRLTGLWRTDEF